MKWNTFLTIISHLYSINLASEPSVCSLKLSPDHECQPSLHSAVVGELLGATDEEIHSVGERLEALLLPAAVHKRDGDSFHPG